MKSREDARQTPASSQSLTIGAHARSEDTAPNDPATILGTGGSKQSDGLLVQASMPEINPICLHLLGKANAGMCRLRRGKHGQNRLDRVEFLESVECAENNNSREVHSLRLFGDWCNGSTTDSDSVSLGSNPRSPIANCVSVLPAPGFFFALLTRPLRTDPPNSIPSG